MVCGGMKSAISVSCAHTHVSSHSANTTVTGSPNVISSDDAKAVVAEAAPPGQPKPIDPEGIYIQCH